MSRVLMFMLFAFFFVNASNAQDKLAKMLDKADLIYDENPAESFSLCESAEREAVKTGNHDHDGNISMCKARYYILIAKYDAAGKELNKAIQYFKRNDDLHNLAGAYSLKNILLYRIGEEDEAHVMLLKSIELYKELEDNAGIVDGLINLSLDYKRAGMPDSMLICLEDLEQRLDDSDPTRFYYYYQNWGIYFQITGDNNRAIQQFEFALKVAEEEKMTDSKATCLMLLSEAYQATGDLKKADQFAEESYNFSEENNLIYESYEALTQWIKVKEAKGDIKSAYDIQKKWIRVENEINDLERIQKVNAIESQLELAEKEKQIAEGEIALQKSNVEGQRAKTRNAWLIGVVAVVVLLLTFTIFIYIRTKKLNTTIQEQKEVVELKSMHLEEALDSIEDSLHYSKLIQSSMLPSRDEFNELCEEHFILYRPKDIVSGDFYWMHSSEDYEVVAVGDCTGHGVPGAMVSMVCHEALNKVLIEHEITDPAEALNKVRDIVVKTFKRNENEMSDGMDISLIMIKDGYLHYAGANNSVWIYRSEVSNDENSNERMIKTSFETCELIELKANKQPVGHYFNPKPFESLKIKLQDNDRIYLFSDGYADQFGGDKGKKLKASNLKSIIANAYGLNMADQGTHLENIFNEWKGDLEQIDDVCILGLKLT